MRYAVLVEEKLRFHPSASEPENRKRLKAARRTLPVVLDTLEALKPRINARYSAWEKALAKRREVNRIVENERSKSATRSDFAAVDPAVAGNTTTLAAAENSELAVKLAHQEIRRRDAARKATRQAGVSEQEEQERRTAGLWDDWESALSKDGAQDDDEMRRNMEDSRRIMDVPHDIVPDGVRKKLQRPRPVPVKPMSKGSEYRYPSIMKSQPLDLNDKPDVPPRNMSPSLPTLPPKPSKERYEDSIEPPRRPDKHILTPDTNSPVKASPTFTFRPSAYLENGEPLRTVFLPPTLRNEFLRVAEPNTRRNLETCGMLCGTLISNALFIQRVVIPDQKSTSDTCETVDEMAFFDYCQKEDLLCLGWIHTHPTQTCFMSSVDLHTHCAYQMMMKESIAIVCAPSKDPS
jgi:STAM-binding protein